MIFTTFTPVYCDVICTLMRPKSSKLRTTGHLFSSQMACDAESVPTSWHGHVVNSYKWRSDEGRYKIFLGKAFLLTCISLTHSVISLNSFWRLATWKSRVEVFGYEMTIAIDKIHKNWNLTWTYSCIYNISFDQSSRNFAQSTAVSLPFFVQNLKMIPLNDYRHTRFHEICGFKMKF